MSADDQRNAPWSRGECHQCGQDVLLARAYPTFGPQTCEACQVSTSAETTFTKRVAAVVAELRAEGQRCRSEAIGTGYLNAADLVEEKLVGVKP